MNPVAPRLMPPRSTPGLRNHANRHAAPASMREHPGLRAGRARHRFPVRFQRRRSDTGTFRGAGNATLEGPVHEHSAVIHWRGIRLYDGGRLQPRQQSPAPRLVPLRPSSAQPLHQCHGAPVRVVQPVCRSQPPSAADLFAEPIKIACIRALRLRRSRTFKHQTAQLLPVMVLAD